MAAPSNAPRVNPNPAIYRFAWVKPLRMLLRMKILQLGGGLGVVVPAAQLLGPTGGLGQSTYELGVLAGLSCGAVAVATTCSWYCERLVQELRLVGGGKIRVSTLNMWGSRKDADFPLSAVEPTYSPEGPDASEAGKAMVPLHLGGTTFMLVSDAFYIVSPLNLNHQKNIHPCSRSSTGPPPAQRAGAARVEKLALRAAAAGTPLRSGCRGRCFPATPSSRRNSKSDRLTPSSI